MKQSPLASQELRGMLVSMTIVSLFAAFWGLSGSFSLPDAARKLALALVVLITLLCLSFLYLVHLAMRKEAFPNRQAGKAPNLRIYRFAVLAECIAIPIAGFVLSRMGREDMIMSAVALIVGLHFFGLIPAFHSWSFAWVGGAMVALALFSLTLAPSLVLFPSGDHLALRTAVVGLGCALILWVGMLPTAYTLWRQMQVEQCG